MSKAPTFDEMKRIYMPILERFSDMHMTSGPLSSGEYVQGLLISIRRFAEANCPSEKKNEACFVIALIKPLPITYSAPQEFEGVKVYYEVRPQAVLA